MSSRISSLREATARYLGGKAVQETYSEEMKGISNFIASEEYPEVLQLLTASEQEIQVGFNEGAQGEIGYFLTKKGFIWKQMRDGVMYEHDLFNNPDDIHSIAVAFRGMHTSVTRGSFEGVIWGEINKIVEASTKLTVRKNFLEP